MLQYYDFAALTTGAQFQLSAPGNYLRYVSGDAGGLDSRILVRNDTIGLDAVLKPGQAVRLPVTEKKATRWLITNYRKAGNITGMLVIGDGQLDDSSITGDVSVIDGGKSRTLNQSAFMGAFAVSAVAAQYSQAQLYGALNVRALVKSIRLSASVATPIVLRQTVTAMATPAGNAYSKRTAAAGALQAACQMKVQQSAGQVTGYNDCDVAYLAANTPYIYTFSEPFSIHNGAGLCIIPNTVNVAISGSFEWTEEQDV